MGQLFKEKNIKVEARLPERVSAVTADLDRIDPGHAQPAVERGEVLRPDQRPDRDRARRARRLPAGRRARQRPRHQPGGPGGHLRASSARRATRSPTSRTAPASACTSAARSSSISAAGSGWRAASGAGALLLVHPAERGARRCSCQQGGMSKQVLIADDEPNIVDGARVPAAAQRLRGARRAQRRRGARAGRGLQPGSRAARRDDAGAQRLRGCQRMREHAEWRHIKIVMLSAKGREAEVRRDCRSAPTSTSPSRSRPAISSTESTPCSSRPRVHAALQHPNRLALATLAETGVQARAVQGEGKGMACAS